MQTLRGLDRWADAFRALASLGFALGLLGALPARADPAGDCAAHAGTYLQGVVVKPPRYAHGHLHKGVELSHTRLTVRADGDGRPYLIAIDNVFAGGYDRTIAQVPPPLDTIHLGDHLSVCGQSFHGGMHWVHTNCGDPPTPADPDGWLRPIRPDGSLGENLEGSTAYCGLWRRR